MQYPKVLKLVSVAKFDESDVKASIASLSFIVTSAAKYGVPRAILMDELQQLGLPREHTIAISKAYAAKQGPLEEAMLHASLKGPHVDSLQWRLDYVIAASHVTDVDRVSVDLRLGVSTPSASASASESASASGSTVMRAVQVDGDSFAVLLGDLKQARAIMAGMTAAA